MKRRIAKIAPYLITAVVIVLLLQKYPLEKIIEELKRGNALVLIPIALFKVAINLLLITWADMTVIHGSMDEVKSRPKYIDILRAKAASSLLDIVGYAAGHGAYAFWIGRFGKLSAKLAAGVMLYIMATDLIAVSTVASASVWLQGVQVSKGLAYGAPIIAFVLLSFIVLGPYDIFGARARGAQVLLPWGRVPPKRGLMQAAVRAAQINFAAVMTWVAAGMFGMSIPIEVMIAYVPIILVVQSLPINVAGFGAVQGAWLLLTDWAPGEQILAFQFVWSVMIAGGIILRGLPFVRRMSQEIATGAPA